MQSGKVQKACSKKPKYYVVIGDLFFNEADFNISISKRKKKTTLKDKGNKMMLYKMRRDEFEKVFDLMVEAFPVDERRTFDEQKELLCNPIFDIYVCKDSDDGEIRGFISVYRFDKFTFVEHFAVNPKYRNLGLGHEILSNLIVCFGKLLLEVEPPETEQAKRRIGFYERNGFYLNDYPYIQPPISKGTNRIPLLLMATGDKLSENEYIEAKSTLYKYVYNVAPDAY